MSMREKERIVGEPAIDDLPEGIYYVGDLPNSYTKEEKANIAKLNSIAHNI